jgi:UDP-N-acetylmuramate dehydrogenase
MPISIRENVPLRDLTTFRVGGPARYFCVVTSEAELVEAIDFSRAGGTNGSDQVPFFILGGGSNILVSDAGFEGLVIKMEIRGVSYGTDTMNMNVGARGGTTSLERHSEEIGQLTKSRLFSKKNPEKMAQNNAPLPQENELSENLGEARKGTLTRDITPDITSDIIRVTAGAGENWDDFVATCVERGLYGLENLSGIPGTVGAAPVQNIGAYGSEVSQTIDSVRVLDTQAASGLSERFFDFPNANCHFGYRDSIFKHEKNVDGTARYIIVSVTFHLKKNAPLNISYKDLQEYDLDSVAHVRAAILTIRAAKLPNIRTVGTAGSFFKNPIISVEHFNKLKEKYADIPSYPAGVENDSTHTSLVKVPLAWILDHVCGYKGMQRGNIGTYGNQALVIVNRFSATGIPATAFEIKKLAVEMVAAVKEKTDIDIEPEVQYVGE